MIGYPKMQMVFRRNPTTFEVDTTALSSHAFGLVNEWLFTEKIDGTNVRVGFGPDGVEFAGRTNRAVLPAHLEGFLRGVFTEDRMRSVWDPSGGQQIVLFGEGYGPKIQNGGSYRDTPGFRLFDVWMAGWWCDWWAVCELARQLEIDVVPTLGVHRVSPCGLASDLRVPGFLDSFGCSVSRTAVLDGGSGCRSEGLVARTVPGLFTRSGERVVWKLRYSDLEGAAR